MNGHPASVLAPRQTQAPGGGEWEVPSPIAPASLADWAEEIRKLHSQGITGTLALARFLYLARLTLVDHGQWTALWRLGGMGMSKRKAEMLVAVGRSLGDLIAKNSARLPGHWGTLYVLAKLDRPVLLQLIGAGAIHPDLTTKQAKALLAKYQKAPGTRPLRPQVKRLVARVWHFVKGTVQDWSAADRALVLSEFPRIADWIKASRPALH